MTSEKIKQVQVRLTAEESNMLDRLKADYGLSYSELIIYALEYVEKNRPSFLVQKVVRPAARPQPKAVALASMTA
jgi:hypothetical protein